MQARDNKQKRLKLIATDAEDLEVISALLQDAIIRKGDISYSSTGKRFAAVVNRFRWEEGSRLERVHCGMHFNGILGVKTRNLLWERAETLHELLAIEAQVGEVGSAEILLRFAGGALIKLDAECIDCELHDLSEAWAAYRKPAHDVDGL